MEPKSTMKSVAANQIKRVCQSYWGGGRAPRPLPTLRHCFGVHKEIYNINIAKRRHSVFV